MESDKIERVEDYESVFDALGGRAGVDDVVRDFYGRLLGDRDLAPRFESADMKRLVRMQQEFLAAALGGPSSYSGVDLRSAHTGQAITAHDFSRFVECFVDTLRARDVPVDTIDRVADRLALYVDDVIGSHGEGG